MKSTFVLASTDTRLQADIMMIRLRRAGIDIDRVSAVFSHKFAPNSFFFWLRSPRTLQCHTRRESFFVAGPLQRWFDDREDVDAVPNVLRRLGVERREAAQLGRALWIGRGVLCVQAKNVDEAAVAWHIFKHSRADDIAVSGIPTHEHVPAHADVGADALAAVAA